MLINIFYNGVYFRVASIEIVYYEIESNSHINSPLSNFVFSKVTSLIKSNEGNGSGTKTALT